MRSWVTGVLLAIVAAGPAGAQVTTTGTVEVMVTDSDGGRIPGATVIATAADVTSQRTATSDGEGYARLPGLEPSRAYVVTIELSGFTSVRHEGVLVRSGQTTTLQTALQVAGVAESVEVTAETPVVDVTRATTGADITLELTEALPTGRSYQSFLQLVPGVMPDNPVQSGNPAARAGLNYSDIARTLGDNVGVSADNAYYFDGINVTDPVTGTFGANLNTEIIQEQKVITGGIPAEFVGVPGLISNVITKSGSNTFHGTANYFFQNSGLVAENEKGPNEEFSTKDTAFTFGGPVMRDRAWFFGSFRYLNRDDDVSALDTSAFLRTVERTDKQGFVKGTWGPTASDVLSFTYLSDPTSTTGRRDRDVTNERDRSREQGGHRYAGLYTRVWGNALLEIGGYAHNAELSEFSVIRKPSNTAIFQAQDVRTLADEQLGGFGRDVPEERNARQARGSLSYTLDRHTLEGGLEWSKNINFRDTLYIESALYESISSRYAGAGVSAADIAGATGNRWSVLAFDYSNPSDFGGFIRSIDARADRARFYTAFDLNRDGTITSAELGTALRFSSTASNPDGQVNYDRTFQSALGPQELWSKGLSFYIQDDIRFSRWAINVGLRAEQWKHYATTGENIFTFDWEFAPRLSAVYDVLGDGRHKASAYYGRYYDPVRNNMTQFAGTLNGSVLEEQVFALGEWVTYRTRGGPTVQDAFFAPTTQTPYTDDLQVGYAVDLGGNQSFEFVYFNRRTRDILEDYDLELYATAQDGQIHYPGPIDHPDSLFLGLEYFGYTQNPGSNFVIATLEGGKRDFHGLEFVYRRRLSDRWQGLVSYNYNRAKGNSNSDSNADFQGDVIFLDPRAPNQYGTQPGVIPHLFKMGGSYTLPMGLQFGAAFGWNSGVRTSRTFRASSRNLPIRVQPTELFEFAGIRDRWIAPNTVGEVEHPEYATFDVRVQYTHSIGGRANAEFFVDIFNLFNNQATVLTNDLVAGLGQVAFGDEVQWVLPRRAFLGARVKF
jgi:hypothetical protein